MTGMRLRDLMLAAGVMVLVVASVSLQLSVAGNMMKGGRAAATAIAAVTE